VSRLFTSESVTPGHPDKVCDQISDAILDAYLSSDRDAHVAAEVVATAAGITIAGEVGSKVRVDHVAIARDQLRRIGYSAESGLDPDAVSIRDEVTRQSKEIDAGVQVSLELRDQAAFDSDDCQGAGDQGLMFGYATDETPELMPLPIVMAHTLAKLLAGARRHVPGLRPDGKTQVTIAYDGDIPRSVETIIVSAQHARTLRSTELEDEILARVVAPAMHLHERLLDTSGPRVLINPSGSFVEGGPAVDTGLTGRKIIVDTYGGAARHGGGAFSGKDPSKVDRSAAYAMRWVAKNVVAAGLASRCEVQVAYAIGRAHPVGLYVDTFGTERGVDPERIQQAILAVFDLRPAAIIRDLRLKAPIYLRTATFGHFGRQWAPWEATDKVEALRAAAGVTGPRRAD